MAAALMINLSARRVSATIVPFVRTVYTPLALPCDLPNEHSQGMVNSPASKHKEDPMSQAARAASSARTSSNEAIDMASPNPMPKPPNMGRGNPEQIGYVEQVGSSSGSVWYFASLDGANKGKVVY